MLHWLWQAAFHLNYLSNSITFPFSDVPSMFKDSECSNGRYTCQHVCLREVRRLKIVGRTWHIRNKGTHSFNKKNNKMNQAHMLCSRTVFVFIYVHHNSQSQTRLYNHQPTLHHPATFLPVSGSFMAVVTLQMFPPTVGKLQCLYALWDMTYVTTYTNMVYLASLILLLGQTHRSLKPIKPVCSLKTRDELHP
jgi:hypothetical protein